MRKPIDKITGTTFFAAFLLMLGSHGSADARTDYTCEIMSVRGQVFVTGMTQPKRAIKEGDILKAGDLIEVGDKSHVDIAYDRRWSNVTRLWEKSKVKIKSVYPTGLAMDHGDVLAKLGRLPKNSTFEIETPTTVAAVRGSEFRTVCEGGVTEVFNLHSSEVEVFTKDLEGVMEKEATILHENEKTEVTGLGDEPTAPEKMTDEEMKENHEVSSDLAEAVKEVVEEGRMAEIQDLEAVEKEYEVELNERLEDLKNEETHSSESDSSGAEGGDRRSEDPMEDQTTAGGDHVTEGMENAIGSVEGALEHVDSSNERDGDQQTEDDMTTSGEEPPDPDPENSAGH